MVEEKRSALKRIFKKSKSTPINRISARELARISRENRQITDKIEKQRNRKNVPESEYVTKMKDPANVEIGRASCRERV